MRIGPPDERAFRKTTSRFPAGVAVVTTLGCDCPRGVTASTFAVVSEQPPLVVVCLRADRLELDRGDGFAISVLAQHQNDVALRFAADRRPSAATAFGGIPWWPARQSGAPVLSGSLAWLDCAVQDFVQLGDQSLVVGRVDDVGHVDGEALLLVDGGYRGLAHPAPPPMFPYAGHDTLLSLVRQG